MKHNPLLGNADEFIQQNIKLIDKACQRYGTWLANNKQHMDYEDLVQIGSIGLMYAYENYSDVNIKFSTYAMHCINGYILRGMENLDQGPSFSNQVKRMSNIIRKKNLQDKSPAELAKILKTTMYIAQSALDHYNYSKCLTVDFTLSNDEESTSRVTYHKSLVENVDYDKQLIIAEFMQTLTPRQQHIMQLHLDGHSNAEIGANLGYSYGSARNIIPKAIKELYQLAEDYGNTVQLNQNTNNNNPLEDAA